MPAARLLIAGVGVHAIVGGLTHHGGVTEVAWGAFTAGAALLMGRTSARAQILARGIAWANVLPTLIVFAIGLRHGVGPTPLSIATAGVALASLALSLPALRTQEAQKAFAPTAFRPWLLATAVASLAMGLESAHLGAAFLQFGGALPFALLSLSLTLVASGIGIARMRAWGVLVGFLSPLFAILVAAMLDGEFSWLALMGTVPAVMLAGVLVAARRASSGGNASRSAAHVDEHASLRATRVRISEEELVEEEADEAVIPELATPERRRCFSAG